MEHFFKNIQIRNFKSIKQLDLNDCSRINLFIGRPNVGKSNILEALSLFSIPHVKFSTDKQLKNFVRIENENEFFFDGNIKEDIKINTNTLTALASYESYVTFQNSKQGSKESVTNDWGLHFDLGYKSEHYTTYSVDENLNLIERDFERNLYSVKKYTFAPNVNYKQANAPFLIPPYGTNLLNCIDTNEKLKTELNQLFKEYGLKLVFDKASQSLKVMKELKGDNIYLIPYNSVADTLQRIIFYKTAIASNKDSILLFEEPEAHSFPPYIAHITQEIIYSTTNQFFITTHSPFILNDFLENSRSELSVFAVNYIEGQTVAKKLTAQELDDIYQNGVDLFTNIETYN
jgi:AAA15 family ATPase/GTPase